MLTYMSARELFPDTEPTLYDVIEVMQRNFTRVDSRFESLETRFDTLEQRFDSLEERFDTLELRFDDLEAQFDTLASEFHLSERRSSKGEIQFEDLSDSVLNHEERLVRIEKWRDDSKKNRQSRVR